MNKAIYPPMLFISAQYAQLLNFFGPSVLFAEYNLLNDYFLRN